MSSLTLHGVSKAFGFGRDAFQALNDVSLELAVGEFVMIVGPSGCGKTTLLNLVAGLEKPDSGEIVANGKPVKGPGPDRSVVFQDGALFPWLSAKQNVEFGLKQAGVPKKDRAERAHKALSRLGLDKFQEHQIHELSGGMRQRVAIARSLVLEPAIVLMDEPFSALDALTREDLYSEIQGLWEGRGTTVLFVTHNVREAVTLGSRVVLMAPKPGRIQEIFEVRLSRPRQIDDLEVSALSHRISQAMKKGRTSAELEGIDEPDPIGAYL